ncbi:hypothetical protein NE237_012647 [Protea cynaroides]|uniref:Uncharacterized protein n=1 Tax=Protea cynaroides TaxID=273540 RepID=A0A9Q0JX26_9MAGN|nr:hypothetical protein NE237_012647 [Protea cynaroides]
MIGKGGAMEVQAGLDASRRHHHQNRVSRCATRGAVLEAGVGIQHDLITPAIQNLGRITEFFFPGTPMLPALSTASAMDVMQGDSNHLCILAYGVNASTSHRIIYSEQQGISFQVLPQQMNKRVVWQGIFFKYCQVVKLSKIGGDTSSSEGWQSHSLYHSKTSI